MDGKNEDASLAPLPADLDSAAMKRARQSRSGFLAHRDPQVIVSLARKHTVSALNILISLMNGRSRQKVMIEVDGKMVQQDVPVPPAVMLRAAEIVLERGYGKSPQAILVKSDQDLKDMIETVPIMERIRQIREARDELGRTDDNVTDLEASEQTPVETEATEIVVVSTKLPVTPTNFRDQI